MTTGATRPRVLIIDDDADTRANLADILDLDGWRVEAAGTAAAALDRDDWADYAAVVLDRRLPDGSADLLLPDIRRLAPQAEVVIVTGYADVGGAVSALRQGAADYILKPIDPGELRTRLGRIADNRRARLRLAQAEERLLQAERLAAIGQMVTGLAHESGNALQRSQACLQILANRVRGRPDLLDLVDRVQAAQDNLMHLYEDVRGYAADIRLQPEPCDPADTWRQAWAELEGPRQNRRAELRERLDGVDRRCRADPFRLKQVFRNLLENALAACADPAVIDVALAAADLDGRPALRVAVHDNGPGVPPGLRARVFEPFFTTKTKGTGLGLAITRRIVEAHDGRIELGDGGPGCEVIITLPREVP
jgi:signal transduction histidine kinase